jgi:hypothetical protein
MSESHATSNRGSLNRLESLRRFVFHPVTVLSLSLLGAVLYVVYALVRFQGDKSSLQLYYVVPIIIPFVAFLLDRAERFRQLNLIQIAVDVVVVGTAMGRVVGNVPFVSGHTLFLTYALLSSRSRVVQVTATMVMLQVIYLKYFVWHDWITSTSGIVLASLAALVSWRFRATGSLEQIETGGASCVSSPRQ